VKNSLVVSFFPFWYLFSSTKALGCHRNTEHSTHMRDQQVVYFLLLCLVCFARSAPRKCAFSTSLQLPLSQQTQTHKHTNTQTHKHSTQNYINTEIHKHPSLLFLSLISNRFQLASNGPQAQIGANPFYGISTLNSLQDLAANVDVVYFHLEEYPLP
jgi:hypothetical protein